MRVLLTGAGGFIGSRLARALLDAGHEVRCAVRDPARVAPPLEAVAADFARDHDSAAWLPRLAGIDVVVNAVGILREQGAQTFDALHLKAPRALFEAAARAGVRRVIQISALGADEHAASGYHLSKKAADDFLLSLPVPAVVVQPSLVYGPGGASAQLFDTLAALPVHALPGGGRMPVQPIHVDDAVAAIVALLSTDAFDGRRVALVGPAPLALVDYLGELRASLKLGRALRVPVSWGVARAAAALMERLPGALLDRETLAMLARGNAADASDTARLLGRAPRAPRDFIPPQQRGAARTQALSNWGLPLLRWSIAAVWIVTGIVSLLVYPLEESYALLHATGIPPPLAPPLLVAASVLDFAIGIAILWPRRRRELWLFQIAVMGFYTVVISFRLPEFWAHPYGPMLKNLPLLAAMLLLWQHEEP
ncbi:SDR family oxidoreductase [Caldimonas tepidiphila]|uniref:SDR family oxidoreductase n=1 Tax=Caldimonas tepidiphila TaxID=2315841 RepID=UPI000E5AD019|nr:SDR family oxidoreductase [Caldimonas tepidiphila]